MSADDNTYDRIFFFNILIDCFLPLWTIYTFVDVVLVVLLNFLHFIQMQTCLQILNRRNYPLLTMDRLIELY